MSDRPEPWERQPGESRQAFEAFAAYRDMTGRRSLQQVAQTLHKSKALLGRWSLRWQWVDRCRAYDDDQDRQWREEVARARVDIARKHNRVGALMLQKAVQRLSQMDPSQLSPTDLERWMRTATEIERKALGDPDDESDAVRQAAGAVTELVRSIRQG